MTTRHDTEVILAQSKMFFLKALRPLGVDIAMEGPYGVGT
jgi:hypothetical protein